MFLEGLLATENPAMYFRDRAIAAIQDMYLEELPNPVKASTSRMDTG